MSADRILFVDTNVYTACAASELEGYDLDVLDKIKKYLDQKEVKLFVPDVIKMEINKALSGTFSTYKEKATIAISETTEQKKESGQKYQKQHKKVIDELREDALKKANKDIADNLQSRESKAQKILENIFSHNETIIAETTNSILLNGVRRALLRKRPSSADSTTKNLHPREIDSIAFESLLFELRHKRYRSKKIIICSDDPDYFLDEEKLHPEIKKELEKLTSSQVAYKNPLEMLKAEFKAQYSAEQTDQYKTIQNESDKKKLMREYWGISAVTPSALRHAGSVFTASSLDSLAYGPLKIDSHAKFCPACGGQLGMLPTSFVHNYTWSLSSSTFHCPSCSQELMIVNESGGIW